MMDSSAWQNAINRACGLIAPVWPLDQWIAVNPFWGLRHQPVRYSERLLEKRAGFSFLMPVAFYREAWEGGRITDSDVKASFEESGLTYSLQSLFDVLKQDEQPGESFHYSVLDVFPGNSEGLKATDAVCEGVGRLCGAYFDSRQARWPSGEHQSGQGGLFEFWLESARQDLSLDYRTGVPGARAKLKAVPESQAEAVEKAVNLLNLNPDELEALCHSLLLRLLGWASWSSGVDWRAGLAGDGAYGACESLLSILLVWESVGLACATNEHIVANAEAWAKIRHNWQTADESGPEDKLLWIWQRAYEIGYQKALYQILQTTALEESASDRVRTGSESAANVQAVFCIDVRSEVMRRHLENHNSRICTLGFAGFFGLPIAHQSHGPFSEVPRLPGLLAPAYRLIDTQGSAKDDHALNRTLDQREITRESVRKAKYSSLSTFTLVETTGLAWAWKLLKDSLHQRPTRQTEGPDLAEGKLVHHLGGDPLAVPEKVKLVAGFLKGMSLTHNFAPLLVFVGHGTKTDNNPNHAGMACGACGGQSGGVNARLAAALFNDSQVREGLAEAGIHVPDTTFAIAAEHCTVTDEVTLFDRDQIPASHRALMTELESSFLQAGIEARKERATPLKLNGLDDNELLAAMSQRALDWSEVRPEWGLANNAAMIFAKRDLTRGKNLSGRVFLHDYDPELDAEGQILEALMAAPMIVGNWINLQYFASVTVPEVYGAGNKLLHSVIGGNLGVIEGNGTDMRIGLPLQSVHDGTYWRHEPLRLTVLVDAPRERIQAVIERQPDVAQLVRNQWLWLHRLLPGGEQERFHNGEWQHCSGYS